MEDSPWFKSELSGVDHHVGDHLSAIRVANVDQPITLLDDRGIAELSSPALQSRNRPPLLAII